MFICKEMKKFSSHSYYEFIELFDDNFVVVIFLILKWLNLAQGKRHIFVYVELDLRRGDLSEYLFTISTVEYLNYGGDG